MWPLLSLTDFLEQEVRVECLVRTSVPAHPEECCCSVYRSTASLHTPQGMLLWGLQRYYLSPHTPYTPRDAAVLWGLQRYYLSPKGCGVYTPLLHPKGCCCGVYRGTTSPHTPQGMLLWGLQRYYLSPHTPRDAAVVFTEVLPLPTHPKGCCCGVYKGTTSPHTPHTSQGMVMWGLQRYYLSSHTPRDAAVGFTEVLPPPTHPVHPCDCVSSRPPDWCSSEASSCCLLLLLLGVGRLHTLRAAREMNDVVFSSSCLQP